MGCGGGHDICGISPKEIEYRVRGDGSVLINAPRISDAPFRFRVQVEVSAEYAARCEAFYAPDKDWRGRMVDELWFTATGTHHPIATKGAAR